MKKGCLFIVGILVLFFALVMVLPGKKTTPTTKQVRLTQMSQMFRGDEDTIYDEVLAVLPDGSLCTLKGDGYFDIGIGSPVKYGYLKCGLDTGWVNAKYYQ